MQQIQAIVKHLTFAIFILTSFQLSAQNVNLGGGTGTSKNDTIEHFKFMPIPYLNYDRSLEFQIVFLPMVLSCPQAEWVSDLQPLKKIISMLVLMLHLEKMIGVCTSGSAKHSSIN